MTPVCSRCDEVVHAADRMCASCGADLRIQVPRLVDLTPTQLAALHERQKLLAEAVAGSGDDDDGPAPGRDRPTPRRWGGDATTLMELEQATYRFGTAPNPDDVLPATPRKRGWRRR